MAKVIDAATANSLTLEAISNRTARQLEANYKQEEENLTESLLLEIYDNIEAAAKEGKFQTTHIIYDEVSFINDGKVKYLYTLTQNEDEKTNELVSNLNVELIRLNSLRSIDGFIETSNDNYFTIINENFESINKELEEEAYCKMMEDTLE